MTYTVIVGIDTADAEIKFPAVKGLTWEQVESEKARVRADMLPGATLHWNVIAEH